jgi:hypothetical protein
MHCVPVNLGVFAAKSSFTNLYPLLSRSGFFATTILMLFDDKDAAGIEKKDEESSGSTRNNHFSYYYPRRLQIQFRKKVKSLHLRHRSQVG